MHYKIQKVKINLEKDIAKKHKVLYVKIARSKFLFEKARKIDESFSTSSSEMEVKLNSLSIISRSPGTAIGMNCLQP